MMLGDYYAALTNGLLPDKDNMLERFQNILGRDLTYRRLSNYDCIGKLEREAIAKDYLNASPIGLNYDYIKQYLQDSEKQGLNNGR